MPRRSRYSPEVRERAVRIVREHAVERLALKRVAYDSGCSGNRGVSPGALLDAARNGTTTGPLIDQLGRESLRISGQAATFAINLLGKVVTAWRQ